MSVRNNKVFAVKLIHAVIFFLMFFCLFYILYTAIARTYNWLLLAAIGIILVEGIILIFNGWQCPLTNLARKYGDKKGTVTDIFLPAWLAPHTFKIFGALYGVGVILVVVGFLLK